MNSCRSLALVSLVVVLSCGAAHAAAPDFVDWTHTTDGRVFAHPTTDGRAVYVGSDDGILRALDPAGGRVLWTFEVGRPIRTQAVVDDDGVVLAIGNEVVALDRAGGELRWRATIGPGVPEAPLDPWDHHGGTPIVHGDELIVGLANGRVVGLDPEDGRRLWEFVVAGEAPVKSGLHVDGSTLYFGDWDGVVHALDLRSHDEIWSVRTFTTRPYASFGMINTGFTTDGHGLFFGARNDTLRVLDKNTGDVLWTHVEEGGGWLSGDPLVLDGTLYIGGSDNHEMQAFDAATGTQQWSFRFLNNCFSRPLVVDDLLLFSTGDAYNVYGDRPGVGYVYAIRRDDGALVNFARLAGNLYTTLVRVDDTIVAASEDGSIHGLSLSRFLEGPARLREKGYEVVDVHAADPSPFAEATTVRFDVAHPAGVRITITGVDERPVVELTSEIYVPGTHAVTWDGRDADGAIVDDGYYFVLTEVGETVLKSFVQKASG